jgi:RND family efflux transporter MFP subunit
MPAHGESAATFMQEDRLSQDLASLKIDRSPAARPKRSMLVPWLIVAVVVLGAVGYFVVWPRVRAAFLTPEVTTGDVIMLSPAQAQVQLTATGYVVALVYAKVAAKVPGRIAEIFVEEGDPVEKDQKVARLEDVDFKSGLAASKARAAAARARVQIAKSSLAEAKVTLAREEPLVEKGVTPRAVLDDLKAKIDSLVAAQRAAEADAVAADAETRSLEVQLGSYVITSPIAGTVVDRLVEVGEGVSPGFGTPGVLEVVDMSSLVVEVDVPETKLSQVKIDGPAEIVLDAYTSKRFRGAVKEIGRRVNKAKATVPIKVRFVDRPEEVLPDMAARVSFLAEAIDDAAIAQPARLVVPAKAVVQRGGRDVVFIVDEGEVRQTIVDVAPADGTDYRELKTQLPVGTKVVIDPPADMSDGKKVKEKQ